MFNLFQGVFTTEKLDASFLERTLELPAVKDTLHYVSYIYRNTKDRNEVVYTVLDAAEKSLELSRNNVAQLTRPIINPLVDQMGGWNVLDDYACKGLDRLETALPLIKQPPAEIMKSTKISIFRTLSGDPEDVDLPGTIVEAVAKRANKTAREVSERILDVGETILKTRGGVATIALTDNVIMYANILLSVALPPSPTEQLHPEPKDLSTFGKLNSLRNRLHSRIHKMVKASTKADPHSKITVSDLITITEAILKQWYDQIELDDNTSLVVLLSQATAKTGINILMSMNDVISTTIIKMQDLSIRLRDISIHSLPITNLTKSSTFSNTVNNLLSMSSLIQAASTADGKQEPVFVRIFTAMKFQFGQLLPIIRIQDDDATESKRNSVASIRRSSNRSTVDDADSNDLSRRKSSTYSTKSGSGSMQERKYSSDTKDLSRRKSSTHSTKSSSESFERRKSSSVNKNEEQSTNNSENNMEASQRNSVTSGLLGLVRRKSSTLNPDDVPSNVNRRKSSDRKKSNDLGSSSRKSSKNEDNSERDIDFSERKSSIRRKSSTKNNDIGDEINIGNEKRRISVKRESFIDEDDIIDKKEVEKEEKRLSGFFGFLRSMSSGEKESNNDESNKSPTKLDTNDIIDSLSVRSVSPSNQIEYRRPSAVENDIDPDVMDQLIFEKRKASLLHRRRSSQVVDGGLIIPDKTGSIDVSLSLDIKSASNTEEYDKDKRRSSKQSSRRSSKTGRSSRRSSEQIKYQDDEELQSLEVERKSKSRRSSSIRDTKESQRNSEQSNFVSDNLNMEDNLDVKDRRSSGTSSRKSSYSEHRRRSKRDSKASNRYVDDDSEEEEYERHRSNSSISERSNDRRKSNVSDRKLSEEAIRENQSTKNREINSQNMEVFDTNTKPSTPEIRIEHYADNESEEVEYSVDDLIEESESSQQNYSRRKSSTADHNASRRKSSSDHSSSRRKSSNINLNEDESERRHSIARRKSSTKNAESDGTRRKSSARDNSAIAIEDEDKNNQNRRKSSSKKSDVDTTSIRRASRKSSGNVQDEIMPLDSPSQRSSLTDDREDVQDNKRKLSRKSVSNAEEFIEISRDEDKSNLLKRTSSVDVNFDTLSIRRSTRKSSGSIEMNDELQSNNSSKRGSYINDDETSDNAQRRKSSAKNLEVKETSNSRKSSKTLLTDEENADTFSGHLNPEKTQGHPDLRRSSSIEIQEFLRRSSTISNQSSTKEQPKSRTSTSASPEPTKESRLSTGILGFFRKLSGVESEDTKSEIVSKPDIEKVEKQSDSGDDYDSKSESSGAEGEYKFNESLGSYKGDESDEEGSPIPSEKRPSVADILESFRRASESENTPQISKETNSFLEEIIPDAENKRLSLSIRKSSRDSRKSSSPLPDTHKKDPFTVLDSGAYIRRVSMTGEEIDVHSNSEHPILRRLSSRKTSIGKNSDSKTEEIGAFAPSKRDSIKSETADSFHEASSGSSSTPPPLPDSAPPSKGASTDEEFFE